MEISKYLFAGVIILVIVVSFAAGSLFTGGLPTIDATGNAANVPQGEISDELKVALGSGGYYDRQGYFLFSSYTLTLSASGPSTPIKIFVDGEMVKECNSSPCTHRAQFEGGVHLYYATSPEGRTSLQFFQIGQGSKKDLLECTDDNLDLSRDAYVEYNDLFKIFDVISGGRCTVLNCDINGDGSIDDGDVYSLAEIVNSCF